MFVRDFDPAYLFCTNNFEVEEDYPPEDDILIKLETAKFFYEDLQKILSEDITNLDKKISEIEQSGI